MGVVWRLPDARISRAQDGSESARTDRADRTVEIRAVEEIEEFRPEIHGKAFVDGERFDTPKSVLNSPGPRKAPFERWLLLNDRISKKLAGDWGGDSRRSGLIDFSDFTVKREVPAVTRSHKYLVETPTLPNEFLSQRPSGRFAGLNER